jgi:hypothetical protein
MNVFGVVLLEHRSLYTVGGGPVVRGGRREGLSTLGVRVSLLLSLAFLIYALENTRASYSQHN